MIRAATLALAFACLAMPACAMSLTSPDIADGNLIAKAQVYSRCAGANVSPQLSWSGAPKTTRSFALTMIDLDVKPAQFSHWIVVDLPPTVTSLAGGASLPAGANAVANNFGNAEYDGPCPPTGSGAHHYKITIWALSGATPALAPDANATDISAALARASLDKASITGWFKQ